MGTPAALALTSPPHAGSGPQRFLVTILAALFVASANAALSVSTVLASDLVAGDGTPDDGAFALEQRSVALPWLAELDWNFEADPGLEETAADDPDEASVVREIKLRPRPRPGAFSMNLYSRGDFLSQQTTYWCIPASTQMMMNMMDGGRPNRTRAFQARLYRVGDDLEEDGTRELDDDDEFWDRDGIGGMGISEWVGLLNRFDYGPYELGRSKTRQDALQKAARLMRKTGKPVGLVVWRGAHAWVMSGFTATADPAHRKDFTVTSVWVHDPWYPRVSSIWGRSRSPNAKVSPETLGQDYLPYDRPGRRHPDRDGRYMLVVPKLAPGTRVV
jgi:hypothetical protein